MLLKRYILISLVCTFAPLYGQSPTQSEDDNRYLEDQFYFGVSYNLLLDTPEAVNQNNLPYGIQLGFIKDIPINSARNLGFGLGLGYATDSYFSNIQAIETNNGIVYTTLPGSDFRRTKIGTHQIEVPIEFRWRTSTPATYKFWRVYGGIKLAYIFSGRSKFVSDTERFSFSNPDIEDFQYGLTLNFGYNTFNIQTYYSLSGLFRDGVTINQGESLQISPLKIGIIFYIL